MSRLIRHLTARLTLGATVLLATHALAASPDANLGNYLDAQDWKSASRLILLEASRLNPNQYQVPARLGIAGNLEDAQRTIANMPMHLQADALLALVRDVPTLPADERDRHIRRSLSLARQTSSPTHHHYILAGKLGAVALAFAREGREEDARKVFQEALQEAKIATSDEKSAGFRTLAGTLRFDPSSIQPWMLQMLSIQLEQSADPQQAAVAYLDLAIAALAREWPEQVDILVHQGRLAAAAMRDRRMRQLAEDGLTRVDVQALLAEVQPDSPLDAAAMFQAQAGNPEEAHDIVAGLSANLYVDHRQDAYRQVMADAVSRKDLATAQYFAEHPVAQVRDLNAGAWRQVAELQAAKGQTEQAASSYGKAVSIATSIEGNAYLSDVKAMLVLAESMGQNGYSVERRNLTLEAMKLPDLMRPTTDKTPGFIVDDDVKTHTLLAEALWGIGLKKEAGQQLLSAYAAASALRDRESRMTGTLLAEIGLAAANIAASQQAGQ